jgi:hypothetical protein
VSRIDYYWIAERLHYRKATHIDHEIVVPERIASLGDDEPLVVARAYNLVDEVLHIPRTYELPLFQVHDTPGARDLNDEVGLAAKKRGHLQNIQHFGSRLDFLETVYIGQ